MWEHNKSKVAEYVGFYANPKYTYKCELFGMYSQGIMVHTTKENTPNAFWRLMQYLVFGNKWSKV